MAKKKEFGSVVFTCIVPLSYGSKIYNLAEKMGCSANKVMQELIKYAADRAYVGHITEDVDAILFKETTEK